MRLENGIVCTDAQCQLHPEIVLAKGDRKRLAAYMAGCKDIALERCVLDLSQNPQMRAMRQDRFPAFVCYSNMFSLGCCRVLTPQEALAVMGFAMPWIPGHNDHCPWSEGVVEALSGLDVMKRVGNAMHVRVVGALLALGLATSEAVAQPA